MKTTEQVDTVRFTTKGQVVIPLRLRRLFHIEDGTRAVVTATPEGIMLKPVTVAMIERGRGIARRGSDDKPCDQWWAEYKAGEKAIEKVDHARRSSR